MEKGISECVLWLPVTSDQEQLVHKESPNYTTSPNVDTQSAKIYPKTNPKSTQNTSNTQRTAVIRIRTGIQNLGNEPSKLMSRNNGKPHRHPRWCRGDLVSLIRFINRALLNSLLQQRKHIRNNLHNQFFLLRYQTKI